VVGRYQIHVSDIVCNFVSELNFEENLQSYLLTRAVNGSGRVDDNRRTSELLIDGKKDINQLSLYFSIYPQEPYSLTNAEKKQTRREFDFPRQTFVSRIIGTLSYEKGNPPEIATGLYAALFIGELQFEELWSCGKLGRKVEGFTLEVFGDAMLQIKDKRIITYHWDQGRDHNDLKFSGFRFTFR
jgi:hypothetical protein